MSGECPPTPVSSLASSTSGRKSLKRGIEQRVRFNELVSVVRISPFKKSSRSSALFPCALLMFFLVIFCFQAWSAVQMSPSSPRIPDAPAEVNMDALSSAQISSINFTFSFVTVIAWPSKAGDEGMLISTGKPLEMKVMRFFQSVISHSGCQLNIIVFTNPLGKENVQKIWNSLLWHGQTTLTFVLVDRDTVFAWTKEELVPRGASTSFQYRIWHWPKFWLKRLLEPLPNKPRFVVMLDIDGLVLKPFCKPTTEMFGHMVASKKCFAGVPEPYLSQDVVRTINTGLLLVDLECIPPNWYSTMVEQSITVTQKLHKDSGQWPPEQWLFSAMFETYPQLFQPLPLRWHRHCSELDVSKNNEVLERAMYMHYCGTVQMDQKAVAGPILTDADLLFVRTFMSGLDKIFANTTAAATPKSPN